MHIVLFSLASIALLQFTTGQPHGMRTVPFKGLKQGADAEEIEPFWRRLAHHHHPKRAESSCAADVPVVTDLATAINSVTYEFQDIFVYVDDLNRPVSTTTTYRNLLSSTQVLAPPSSSVASVSATEIPSPSSQPAPPSPPPLPVISSSSSPVPAAVVAPAKQEEPGGAQVPHPSQSEVASILSSPSPSPSHGGGDTSAGPGFGSAISYTPYNSDNSCKSAQQVAKDLQQISNYDVLRLYGTDCDQVANVIAATKGSVKLFLGIFDIDSIQSEVQTISSAVNGNWAIVNAINVGNELVNSGKASAGQVTAAIGSARSALKAAGYSGPVVTVDTMVAMKNNPSLCTASDFCAINCHAFFDGGVLAEGAGDFVKNWAQQVSEAAGGKTVVVTESGWPTQGGTNDKAIASPEAHTAAISSLKSAFGGGQNLILYAMYNEEWKKDSGTTFG